CKEESKIFMPPNPISLTTINDTTINVLTTKRIFFGHKSVGFNMLEGLSQLQKDDPRLQKLTILEWLGNQLPSEPGIYHTSNGKNGYPETKCDAFLQTLRTNQLGSAFDVAFFKFCYVDFSAESDIQTIFEYYVHTIGQVQQAFPHLKIIHVTTPLYVHTWTIKNYLKRLFIPDLANVKRNEFNTRLHQKYDGREPIFDLAQIEATLPDGTHQTFTYQGKTYFALAKIYSSDGGHLNELGRRITAQEFIRVLAQSVQSTTEAELQLNQENH
ncbi:hypothetical protein L0128_21515, partial [candidate division KSB1 bacterium]|nr:hypothetical protein [candidate division KSB1 bacterium]